MPFRRTSIDSNQRTGFYSPKRSRVVGSRVVGYDSDALVYINAVEAADGQALEGSVKDAYNTFVVGCKSDGIWNAIKASCIMAGARTLSGALTPLVGVAPSGFNLASGTYSRVTGLKGDGAAMYLDSNRNNNVDPQNSKHLSVWVSAQVNPTGSFNYVYLGTQWDLTGSSFIGRSGAGARALYASINSLTATASGVSTTLPGFYGANRSSSSTVNFRIPYGQFNAGVTSQTPRNETISIFRGGLGAVYAPQTLSFYSIGESLDLALLDSRVDRLVNDIAFSINTGLSPTAYNINTLKYVNRGYAAGGSLS